MAVQQNAKGLERNGLTNEARYRSSITDIPFQKGAICYRTVSVSEEEQ